MQSTSSVFIVWYNSLHFGRCTCSTCETCLVPVVQVIGNCLKFLSRNCWKYVLDNFCRFVMCVCVCVWIITQKIVMWCQIRGVRRPQGMTNHWVLKIVLLGDCWIIGCMGSYTILLEEPVFLLLVAWIRKDGVRICAVCTILNFLCLNVLTLKAYCTPTLMFCNGTCSLQHKSEECEPSKQDKLWENLYVWKFNTFLMGVLADSRNWIY